jgi:hypothetical protein
MYLIGVVGRFVRWSGGVVAGAGEVVIGVLNWARGILVRPVRVMGGNMVRPVRVMAQPAVEKRDDVYGFGGKI